MSNTISYMFFDGMWVGAKVEKYITTALTCLRFFSLKVIWSYSFIWSDSYVNRVLSVDKELDEISIKGNTRCNTHFLYDKTIDRCQFNPIYFVIFFFIFPSLVIDIRIGALVWNCVTLL